MNIEILSMQEINNMGSLLQAYGLKKTLENILKSEVCFLGLNRRDCDDALMDGEQLSFNNEYNSNAFFDKIKYFRNILNNRKSVQRQSEIFDDFRDEYLPVASCSQEYDLCIVGSDEVFNCMNAGYWGFTTQLFGNVPNANKIITYAASCGATSYNNLPEKVKLAIRESFDNISSFSVRDCNTFDFVSNMSDKTIEINLDPVLITNFDEEISRANQLITSKKYCIVYSYRNRISDQKEISSIKKFCKANNLDIIAVGAPQYWIKDYIVCSPFECLKLFKEASFVITDTFHGTIFSAKYTNKFCTLIRESNNNKLTDLVNRLNINKHVLNELCDLQKIYSIEKDKLAISTIILNEKNRTLNYLKHNVSETEV